MWLPTPNQKEVQESKALCKRRMNIELTDDEALDGATRLLHVFILSSEPVYRHYTKRAQNKS